HGAARAGLRRHLRGVRRRLAGSLEPHLARGGPGDHVPDGVGDRHDRVVEGAPDVSMPVGYVLAFLPAHLLGSAGTALWRHLLPVREVVGPVSADYFLPAFFLPATVFLRPLRVRALVWVRWPWTGSPRRWRMPW